MEIFVATLLPFHDGSGETKILGVFDMKEKAQARCFRELQNLGYDQPINVSEHILNQTE